MKLTPVFPANILPVRSGVYATQQIDDDGNLGASGYSWFDLEYRVWGCQAATIEEAAAHQDYEFANQTKMWRGLES